MSHKNDCDNHAGLTPRYTASARLGLHRPGGQQGALVLGQQGLQGSIKVQLVAALQGPPGRGEILYPAPPGVDYVAAIDAFWST